jgi:hypothetical protein
MRIYLVLLLKFLPSYLLSLFLSLGVGIYSS